MKSFFTLFFLIFFTSIFSQTRYKLHFISFYDNEDITISEDTEIDINKTRELLLNISKLMKKNCDTEIEVIDYNKSNVFSVFKIDSILSNLKVGNNDIIYFLYSGHGFHTLKQSQKNRYPFMYFTKKENKKYNLLKVHEALLKFNARLLLTIGDLCNTINKNSTQIDEDLYLSLNIEFSNYIKLFNKARGDLIVTSSDIDEPSFPMGAKNGSFFNTHYINALIDVLQYKDKNKDTEMKDVCNEVTWECVMKKANYMTVKSTKESLGENKIQHPVFNLNIIYE